MATQVNLAHLLPPSWKIEIDRWYAEDTPSFDWGGLVVGEEPQEAFLWAKSGVITKKDDESKSSLMVYTGYRGSLLEYRSLTRYSRKSTARTFSLLVMLALSILISSV